MSSRFISSIRYRLHERCWPLLTTALTAAAWLLAAWFSRDPRPWAVALTEVLFAAALTMAYVCGWSLAALLRPARQVALRAAATSLALLALWALAEAPALLGVLDYSRLFSLASGEWLGPAESFVAHPELGWARPPHSRWNGRPRSDMAVAMNLPVRARQTQSFTTDARGFRNGRHLDHAVIALVGDSYIEGAYVSDEETVAVALESLTRVPVANLGRSGYGALQELLVLRRYALPLRPRMVAWFFFEGNDLYDDEQFENAVAYLRAHGSYDDARRSSGLRRLRQASLAANTFRLLRRLSDPIVPVSVPTFGWFKTEHGALEKLYFYHDALRFGEFEHERLGKAQEAFRSGAAVCREQGVELLLVFIPTKFRVYGPRCEFPPGSPCREWRVWDLQSRLESFCKAERIAFLDLTGPMSTAAAAGRLLYAAEDSHWNPVGHRFVAELLAAAMTAR